MLERHGYHRPIWQSPADFAKSLIEKDGDRFMPVSSLTDIFYEIRFGYRTLDENRLERVRNEMRHLDEALAGLIIGPAFATTRPPAIASPLLTIDYMPTSAAGKLPAHRLRVTVFCFIGPA